MKFFIHEVTVYKRKSRKAEAIQNVVKQCRHILLDDEKALMMLVNSIERLVDVANKKFPGSELSVGTYVLGHGGQIEVAPKSDTLGDKPILRVEYDHLLETQSDIDVNSLMREMVRQFAPEIYGANATNRRKGGEA